MLSPVPSFQGTIEMVEKQMLPSFTQLAVDYESISAVNPPVKKAAHSHTVSDEALTLIKNLIQ